MKYLFLLYGRESLWAELPEAERSALYARHAALGEALTAAGKEVGGEELAPTHTATTLRYGSEGTVVTDGPFAEAREQLGGFYLLDCADLDEALRWARQIPMIDGAVEIRPVVEHPMG